MLLLYHRMASSHCTPTDSSCQPSTPACAGPQFLEQTARIIMPYSIPASSLPSLIPSRPSSPDSMWSQLHLKDRSRPQDSQRRTLLAAMMPEARNGGRICPTQIEACPFADEDWLPSSSKFCIVTFDRMPGVDGRESVSY